MVIVVEHVKLCATQGSLLGQVLGLKYIRHTCASFLDNELCLGISDSSIHVFQGEHACGVRTTGGHVRFVGSSAATTCVIAVLVDSQAGVASVCHLDETTSCSDSCLQACLTGMNGPALYLVGGYCDKRSLGPGTCERILKYYNGLEMPIHLQLCCVANLNTDALGAPKCQSLAVDLRSFAAAPAIFADRGPLEVPRLAQLWLPYSNPKLQDIYDPCRQQLVLRLHEGGGDQRLCSALLLLADTDPSQFMHQVSTSPGHEEPGFLEDEMVPVKDVLRPLIARTEAEEAESVLQSACRACRTSEANQAFDDDADMKAVLQWLLQQGGPRRLARYSFVWTTEGWQEGEGAVEEVDRLTVPDFELGRVPGR